MSKEKTITFAIMEPPFESARGLSAFRLIDAAIRTGLNVNVFAYEGAVLLPFARNQIKRPLLNSASRSSAV